MTLSDNKIPRLDQIQTELARRASQGDRVPTLGVDTIADYSLTEIMLNSGASANAFSQPPLLKALSTTHTVLGAAGYKREQENVGAMMQTAVDLYIKQALTRTAGRVAAG